MIYKKENEVKRYVIYLIGSIAAILNTVFLFIRTIIKKFYFIYAINLVDLFTFVGTVVAVIMLIVTLKENSRNSRKERIKNTVKDFPIQRDEMRDLGRRIKKYKNSCNKKNQILRNYAIKMDNFAVGINEGVYELDIVNKMSGGVLLQNYEEYLRDYICEKRKNASGRFVHQEDIYGNYEIMINKLYQIRKKTK